MWMLFHTLACSIFYSQSSWPVFYLNPLQRSKSQLCKITLGNHKQGERTPCISHTCIKYVFKIQSCRLETRLCEGLLKGNRKYRDCFSSERGQSTHRWNTQEMQVNVVLRRATFQISRRNRKQGHYLSFFNLFFGHATQHVGSGSPTRY